jgi:nucleolar protein 6
MFDPFSKKKIVVAAPARNTGHDADVAGNNGKALGGKKRAADADCTRGDEDAGAERGSKKARAGSDATKTGGAHAEHDGNACKGGSQRPQQSACGSGAKSARNDAEDTSKMSAGEKRKAEKKQAKVTKFDHSDDDDDEGGDGASSAGEDGDKDKPSGDAGHKARDKTADTPAKQSASMHTPSRGSQSLKSERGASAGVSASATEATQKKDKDKHILFVGQLPYSATRESVLAHFKGCAQQGRAVSVRMLTDKTTKKPRGIAFVEFEDEEDANRALLLDYSTVGGRSVVLRALHVPVYKTAFLCVRRQIYTCNGMLISTGPWSFPGRKLQVSGS